MNGEFAAIERLASFLPRPAGDETWIGDDAAVVASPSGWLLLAVDSVVAGVHADLALTSIEDLGWKAVVANVSDIAAMGGRPHHALVSVAGSTTTDLDGLYRGIAAASRRYDCPVVGGDLVNSPTLVVTVAVTGSVTGAPVRRVGARPGDGIWVTGPLGGAAAGLRLLRDPDAARTLPPGVVAERTSEHARPLAAVEEGTAARAGGATAMIDVSDGFAADLGHLADSSNVGFELDAVPVAEGATEKEALGGGEDYRLVFTAPDPRAVMRAFSALREPVLVGRCTADPAVRVLRGTDLPPSGWQHAW